MSLIRACAMSRATMIVPVIAILVATGYCAKTFTTVYSRISTSATVLRTFKKLTVT